MVQFEKSSTGVSPVPRCSARARRPCYFKMDILSFAFALGINEKWICSAACSFGRVEVWIPLSARSLGPRSGIMEYVLALLALLVGGVVGYLWAERRARAAAGNLQGIVAAAEQRCASLASQFDRQSADTIDLRAQ